jgi:uncharacterized protein (DUF1015 family)
MSLLKPFRALRYDERQAGPLDDLVAPPHDVIKPDGRERLLARSPYNAVRLVHPERPEEAARALRDWRARGILVRESEAAVWVIEERFVGPEGVARTRRGIAARVRLESYSAGHVLPHERTFADPKNTRLRLLRATRTKLSPILILHEAAGPELPDRRPDLEATLEGATTRAWRVPDAAELAQVGGRLVIADGHHRYETALRFHEEEGSEETGYVLAVLVSRRDEGLTIFPTHRLVSGAVPDLDGRFRLTELAGGVSVALEALAELARDHPAFVLLRPDGAVLAEGDGEELDTAVVDGLSLERVRFTPSAAEAEAAVRTGGATAAFLVRAPTVEQVAAAALAGERMPQKSTYFFPKLASGILFSPFDE